MNHLYNSFLDKNLSTLLDIYQKEIAKDKTQFQSESPESFITETQLQAPPGCLIIKIDLKETPEKQINVFYQSYPNLDPHSQQEMQLIVERSEQLLKKDRHVLTCTISSSTSLSQQEVFFLIADQNKSYLLRGYSHNNGIFEFETFLDKPDGSSQLETGTEDGPDHQDQNEDNVIDDEYLYPTNPNFKGNWMIQNTDAGQRYLRLCRKALKDEETFNDFRNQLAYQNILIGGTEERIQQYLDLYPSENFQSNDDQENSNKSEKLKKIKECDQIGNPPIPTNSVISTYTIRTFHTLTDLTNKLGSLENKRIVEIGSGHGGLCHMVSKFINYKSYTLIDLPAVNQLAEKYLDNFLDLPHHKIKYMNTEHIVPRKYDVLISEYALSELDLKAQIYYFENVIKYCDQVYLAMNIWDELRKNDFKKRLKHYFSSVEEYPEQPPSKYPNYILIAKK